MAVANPVMVMHMIGGGHNDLLVVGMLPRALVALRRGRAGHGACPALGIAMVRRGWR